jgi:hypothetical protein
VEIMKIHRVVTMLGATTTTGKLASDMYDLNNKTYYSEAEQRDIPISHMDFQHLVRAFVKLSEQEDMLDRSKHMGTTKDLVSKIERLESIIEEKDQDAMNTNKSWVDYTDTLTKQKKNVAQERIIDGLRSQVETLNGIIEEKDEQIDKLHEEKKPKGYEYMFSEIPNTEYGEKLVKSMRAYLNDETYTMRVRGQHLKKELYGQGRAYWGQSIEDSSHLRVYINKKHIKWKDIK